MKLRHLEDYLSRNRTTFSRPKIVLEQYATDPHLASCLAWTAHEAGHLEGCIVADLGCGTGMLSLAVGLFALLALSIDIDSDVFGDMGNNVNGGFECILADVTRGLDFLRPGTVDTAVTNPPFGTKNNAGIDSVFVEKALSIAPVCYSMHKAACRQLLLRKLARKGFVAELVAEMSFDLPKQYRFHKEDCVSIAVDLVLSTTEQPRNVKAVACDASC